MNKMYLKFDAISENEGFARTCVTAFILPLNPTVEELSDVKTAVSEAVTNSVVHAYPEKNGEIELSCELDENELHIVIKDCGQGIENIDLAVQPFYTTKPVEERTGMGFTVMKAFMDDFEVESKVDYGTTIKMLKRFQRQGEICLNKAKL